MIKKCEYKTQEERQQILNDHSNLILIEEDNWIEGNFLVFSDVPLAIIEPKPTYEELENQILLLTDMIVGGIL